MRPDERDMRIPRPRTGTSPFRSACLRSRASLLPVLVLSAVLLLQCTPEPGPPPPPHIVLILADDLGWGDLACFGHPHVRTPNLDRLAADGTRFEQFYVQAPICSPTRAGILTGLYPAREGLVHALGTASSNARHGVPDWLDPDLPTAADAMRARGYRTAVFGKWHLGRLGNAPDPGQYGFDAHRTVNSTGPGWAERGDDFFRARSSKLIVDEAIRFLDECEKAGVPGFVNCWTLVPHDSLAPTADEYELYRDVRFNPVPFPEPTRSYLSRAPHFERQMRTYCAAVSGLDAAVGDLLAYLDENDLTDRTLILFTSDNGPADYGTRRSTHAGVGSTGPFRGRKRSLYEGGVRMPMIARWPGHVPAGAVDRTSVIAGFDLPATFAAIADARGAASSGNPRFEQGDGIDRSGVLLGVPETERPPLFWIWTGPHVGPPRDRSPELAIRHGNWKLYANLAGNPLELYDLAADPSETTNVRDREPETVSRLAKLLTAWQQGLPASDGR